MLQQLLQLNLVLGNAATATTATTASNCTGNSATASKLATVRKISLTGAVSGSGNFDGSSNLSITTNQANIAVLTGNITITNGQGNTNIDYPSGYNQNNCVPIAGGCKYSGTNRYAFGAFQSTGATGVYLNSSSIGFAVSAFEDGVGPSGTYPYKIVLMKIA